LERRERAVPSARASPPQASSGFLRRAALREVEVIDWNHGDVVEAYDSRWHIGLVGGRCVDRRHGEQDNENRRGHSRLLPRSANAKDTLRLGSDCVGDAPHGACVIEITSPPLAGSDGRKSRHGEQSLGVLTESRLCSD